MILCKEGIDIIKEVKINKDSGLYQVVLNSQKGTRTFWIGNIYLNKGCTRKIQTLFRKIERAVPSDYLANTFLIGDFNVNLNVESAEKLLFF